MANLISSIVSQDRFCVPLALWRMWGFIDHEKEPKMFPFLSFAVLLSDPVYFVSC